MDDKSKNESGAPLQILEFSANPDPSKQHRALNVDQSALERIFQAGGDLPISIIAIAGPSRQGKSFFLDFLIRYLESLEKGEDDWMGWDDTSKPLTGFKWCTAIERETTGIVMWSRPFIVKKSDDTKVAVFLMDTQGTYDEFSTEKEMSAVVGLSLLSSSCLIFNFFNALGEDVFNSLNAYVQYGKLAFEKKTDQDEDEIKPFQKLMFLIRDWGMPTQQPYGSKGGAGYLKKKMEIKDGLTPAGKEVRLTLKQCFEQLECFLMPGLGEKSKEAGFDGSLGQLGQTFAKKLEELVNGLLNPEELPLKTVFGQEVASSDMVGLIGEYAKIFNSDEIPAPVNLMEATVKIANDQLVKKCLRKYKESMAKRMKKKKFWGDTALQKLSKLVIDEALKLFGESKPMGNDDQVECCQGEMMFQIKQDAFPVIEQENKQKKVKIIQDLLDEAVGVYLTDMGEEYQDKNSFLEETRFKSISSKKKSSCIDDFKEKLDGDVDEKELDNLVEEQLEKRLEEEESRLDIDNKNRKLNAEKKMGDEVNEICDLYREELNARVGGVDFVDEEELIEFDKETRPDFFKRLDRACKNYSKNFMSPFLKKLESDLERVFDEVKTAQQLKLNELEKEGDAALDQVIAEMETSIRSEGEDLLDNLDESMLLGKAESLLEERLTFPPASKMGTLIKTKLRTSLPSKFQQIVQELQLAKKEIEESYVKAVDEGLAYAGQELTGFVGVTWKDEDELEDFCRELMDKAMGVYEDYNKAGVHANADDYLDGMKTKLGTIFTDAMERNKERKEKAMVDAQNLVHEGHNTYQELMMKNLDVAKDKNDFYQLHEQAKSGVLDGFKTQCGFSSYSMEEPFLIELENRMDSSYQDELLDILELKLLERQSGTNNAIAEARKLYREEMQKRFKDSEFMRPKDLQDLHEKMSKLAIDKCLEKSPLTSVQLGELESSLEETFKEYKEDNDKNVPVEEPAIGIDLGTTYSCVAVYYRGSVRVIPNGLGENTMPSYVWYSDDGSKVEGIGFPAKNDAYTHSESTIYDAKRIIGRKFDDEKLQDDMKLWPFKVENDRDVPKIRVGSKLLFPEQVSSEILKEMRSVAEKYLNCSIKNAVITVPAYFTDGQRQATIDAGKLAGLNVMNILTEPVAAAVAYKLQHHDDSVKNVLTFDLGGGTFDVAILKLSRGKVDTIGVDGDTHLGGEDFDKSVMRYCALEFQREHGVDLLEGKDSTNDSTRQECRRRLHRLQMQCEKMKKQLSSSCRSVDICVDGIWNEGGSSLDLKVKLTRDKFEELNEDLFEKAIGIVDKCLTTAGMTKDQIDDIVLVGGSTRIPKVQELLTDYFEQRALNRTINPDEAVAYGAAVQAAVMNGQIAQESKDYNKIQDVTPMSMGVEVYGGGFSIIIPKNTKVPIKFKEQYRTAHNNQTSVQITVYQGEDVDCAKNNEWLGEFYLNNVPPRDAGVERIDVTMEINMQGVLHVTAVCTSTGEQETVTVTEHKRRMGKDEIHRILGEARPGGA